MTKLKEAVKKCKDCGKFKNCTCKEQKFEIVSTSETIQNIQEVAVEVVSNEETIQNIQMNQEFEKFLTENTVTYMKFDIGDGVINYEITGLKKKVFVKIDNSLEISNVFTIPNKKENLRENARNILTLKSLKATKSFTNCHIK